METILVVDDNSVDLAVKKALLESTYEVALAKSGLQALGYLKRNPVPDLILLDSEMPGMSGLKVVQNLRQDPATSRIPILMELESFDLDLITKGYQLEVGEFVVKPIAPVILLRKTELLLRLSRLEKENLELREKLLRLEIEETEDLPEW